MSTIDRNLLLTTPEFIRQREYWSDRLRGNLETTSLDLALQGGETASRRLIEAKFTLPEPLSAKILDLGNRSELAAYIILLTGLEALLLRYCEQDLVTVLSPVFQPEPSLGDINHLVYVSCRPPDDATFKDLLQSTKQRVLEAYENQDYPIEKINDIFLAGQWLSSISCLLTNIHSPVRHEAIDLGFEFSLDNEHVLGTIFANEHQYGAYHLEQLTRHYAAMLESCLRSIQEPLAEIELFPYKNHRQTKAFPENRTLSVAFEEQATSHPHRIAVSDRDLQISYSFLNQSANHLAGVLAGKGITRDVPVALTMDRCPELLMGILAILKAGGGYVPIDPGYPEARRRYILQDSAAPILLIRKGDTRLTDVCPAEMMEISLSGLQPENPPASSTPDSLAYIIYTSGTTGKPKGVMVEHKNVMQYCHWGNDLYLGTGVHTFPLFTSIAFDLTVSSIFIPLTGGHTIEIYRDSDTGLALETLAAENRVDIVKLTPSHLKMLRQLPDFKPPSRIHSFILGGESLETGLCAAISADFQRPLRIYNEYGPTEATVGCMIHTYDPLLDTSRFVSIGTAIANASIYLLDRKLRPVPNGVIGQLYIGGAGIARGYANRPALTEARFVTPPVWMQTSGETGKLYHSGDLARKRPDGALQFCGRRDHQVKIHGYRIELTEISAMVKRYPAIEDAIVTVRKNPSGDERLIGYFTATQPIEASLLAEFLSGQLPPYMIPHYFMPVAEIPLTINGKIDVDALPEPFCGNARDIVAPGNAIEKTLAEIWASVLKIATDTIGIHDRFFELGGHSLSATIMSSRIHKQFGVVIPLSIVFESPTIESLAAHIAGSGTEEDVDIRPVEKKDYFVLSAAQERLFILHRLAPQSTVYNMPQVIRLTERISVEHLTNTIETIIRRHESFRTSFHTPDRQPVQRVWENVDFSLQRIEEAADVIQAQRAFIRPFDLSSPPLLRAAVIFDGEAPSHLLTDMHHIISDGVSMTILQQEFQTLLAGRALPPLRIHYKDYAVWQRSDAACHLIQRQEEFWLDYLDGELPVLELPYDFPRPQVQDFSGAGLGIRLSAAETENLVRLSGQYETTLFMTLSAVFALLLAKLSRRQDIIVGFPVAGRRRQELESIIGMFVNTLPLRSRPEPEQTIEAFIGQLKHHTIQAFDNQDYPLEKMVERLSPQRDISRNPLFDVMLILQNQEETSPGQKANGERSRDSETEEFANPGHNVSRFDMTWSASEQDRRLSIHVEYSTSLFTAGTIRRFLNYFRSVASRLGQPHIPIKAIEIIGPEEKREILAIFNSIDPSYHSQIFIIDQFQKRAHATPHRTALVHRNRAVTYGAFDIATGKWASALKQQGLGPGFLAAVAMERSEGLVAAIIAILKTGAAYVPIDPTFPESRQRAILDDCHTEFLLTEGDHLANRPSGDDCFSPPPAEAGAPAYVIFTSGSTGRPKGAVIPHKAVANTLSQLQTLYPVEEGDRILLKTNVTFDVSVTELFGWFYGEGSLAILPQGDERDPLAMIASIAKHGVTHINFVPSMLSAFLEFVTGKDAPKLHSLKYIMAAGEAFHPGLVRQLKASGLWGQVRVENIYGPTEAAIYAAFFSLRKYDGEMRIPIGGPLPGAHAYIVDEGMNFCPVRVPGELLIGGAGVGLGYLNQPELTQLSFLPDPHVPGGRIYRSGDLCSWRANGDIDFFGRIDHQVKIRGFRIELGEIQTVLLQCPGVTDAVALAQTAQSGDNIICAYVIAAAEFDGTAVRRHIESRLPAYMIPQHIIPMEEFPLTASGKVDRRRLPAPEAGDVEEYTPPANPLERTLTEIWADVLALAGDKISTTASFFSLGGHSLKATILINRIHRTLDVVLPLQSVFRAPTVKGLAQVIEESRIDAFIAIDPGERQDYYPLSSQQERLFFLQELDPQSTVYNMPQVIRLPEDITIERLHRIIAIIIKRHESLRTSFLLKDHQPVQRVHPHVDFQLQRLDGDFIRPFDLSSPPLMRAAVAGQGGAPTHLWVDLHHIVSDGISMGILRKEFQMLVSGDGLPTLRLQYKDYTLWQRSDASIRLARRQETFWLEYLSGEIPALELPCDFPRPAIQNFSGNHLRFTLDTATTEAVGRLAREAGATLFMTVAAAFFILLGKLGGQEDICLGIPIGGRNHSDLEPIIGVFVNTLVLRQSTNQTLSATQFLANVRDRALQVFENQDVQFENLVEKVAVDRDPSRNPLFDVMFDLRARDALPASDRAAQETAAPITDAVGNRFSRFDMSWTAVEQSDGLLVGIEYCTALFKEETILRFAEYFKRIAAAMTESPDRPVRQIEIMSAYEREEVLVRFNDTLCRIPEGQTIVSLFDNAIASYPDNIAVETGDMALSYRRLSQSVDRTVYYLRSRGAGHGTITGILTSRSNEMITGIMAILRAGSAYLPIDPDYPEERIDYLIKDSGTDVLVTDDILDSILHGDSPRESGQDHTPLPTDPAYVIYTSGSTGKPKGVLVLHGGLVNLVIQQGKLFGTDTTDRVLQFSTYSFDASVEQIFIPLCAGAVLVMIHKNELLDPVAFQHFMEQRNITDLNTVPGFLASIGLKHYPGLRRIVSGGDVCPPSLAFQWPSGCTFFNTYGPTETTVTAIAVDVSCLDRDSRNLPIGRPIGNTSVYILDRYQNPLPRGLAGELYIGGIGVAAGYLNRPELTRQYFLPNPFIPGERMYRTGDQARILPDNHIEFLGRTDHQVKIRGYRIELEEIDRILLTHPRIKESLVTARLGAGGEKRLCAYVVLEAPIDTPNDFAGYLAKKLPEYMIPSFFVPLAQFPLTANGKIDRKALPDPGQDTSGDIQHITDPLEQTLQKIWADVLDIQALTIGPRHNFFRLGGHSLKATILIARIHKQLNVRVPLAEIFTSPTIRGLSDYIKTQAPGTFVAIPAAEKKDYHPLSPAQKRLYILQRIDPQSTAYNIPQTVNLPQRLSRTQLESIFQRLFHRHDSLRTAILTIDDEPVQKIYDCVPLPIDYHEQGQMDLESHIKPFVLSEAPLLRIGVILEQDMPRMLLLDIHHIIGDGMSLDELAREFRALAQGEPLRELRLQYKDFAEWQQFPVYRSRVEAQLQFWLDALSGLITPLELPLDHPRPETQRFAGGIISRDSGPGCCASLTKLASNEQATMYMILLAAFDILLSQLSGQEDIWCGTPVSGRNHADLEGIVGMFVNTLVLRTRVEKALTFRQLLSRVKDITIKAFSNQDCQFDTIVERLLQHRDSSRNPLFDVMFEYTKIDGNLPADIPKSPRTTAKFDLILHALHGNDGLRFFFAYNAALMEEATIRRFAGYFDEIIDAIINNPDGRPDDIAISTSFHQELLEEPEIDFDI